MAAASKSAMCILLIFLLPILLFAFKGEDSEDYEYKLNQDYIIGDEDVYDSSNSRAGVTGAPLLMTSCFCTFIFC